MEAFLNKLKASGKTWEQFLKERDAEESERIAKLNKAVKVLYKGKGQ